MSDEMGGHVWVLIHPVSHLVHLSQVICRWRRTCDASPPLVAADSDKRRSDMHVG